MPCFLDECAKDRTWCGKAAMRDYWSIPGFAHAYLEDSWVLSISAQPGSLVLVIDVVLLEQHPA